MPKKKIIPRGDYTPDQVNYKQFKTPEPGSQDETDAMQKQKGNEIIREKKGEPMTSQEGVDFNKSNTAEIQKETVRKKFKLQGKKYNEK